MNNTESSSPPDHEVLDQLDMASTEVASLLVRHGVGHVILTACRSADVTNASSSIAKCIAQKGITSAVGMGFDLLESAANIFAAAFYEHFLSNRRPFEESVAYARKAMRSSPQRKTRFHTQVRIKDYILPILYSNTPTFHGCASQPVQANVYTTLSDDDNDIFGRESDILLLEKALLQKSNSMLVHGSAGVGKSTLLSHLQSWWKATGLVREWFSVDFSTNGLRVWDQVLAALYQTVKPDVHFTEDQFLQHLNRSRSIVVFDSLDMIRPEESPELKTFKIRMIRFLKKVKTSLVLVCSRREATWLDDALEGSHHLHGLELQPSLHFSLKCLAEYGKPTKIKDHEEIRFMELCVQLVDGHPLALQLMMQDYSRRAENPIEYFRRLTSGQEVMLDQTWISHRPGARCIRELRTIIQETLFSEKVFTEIIYLAPFWQVCPANMSVYFQLLERALRRIEVERNSNSGHFCQLSEEARAKSPAQEMDEKEEYTILPLETNSIKRMEDRKLADKKNNELVSDLLSPFRTGGFIGDEFRVRFQTHLHPDIIGYCSIHPVMPLVLRTYFDVLPQWSQHAIEIAFQRFYVYRSYKIWPTNIKLCQVAWEDAHRQSEVEYANHMTGINFRIQIEPKIPNVLALSQITNPIFSFAYGQRRLPAYRDLGHRLLDSTLKNLARLKIRITPSRDLAIQEMKAAVKDSSLSQQFNFSDIWRLERNAQIRMCVHLVTVLTNNIMRSAPAQSYEVIVDSLIEDHVDSMVPKDLLAEISTAKLVCHYKNPDHELEQENFKSAYDENLRTKRGLSAEKIQESWDVAEQPHGIAGGFINTSGRFSCLHNKAMDAESAGQIVEVEQELRAFLVTDLNGLDARSLRRDTFCLLCILAARRKHWGNALEMCSEYGKILDFTMSDQTLLVILEHQELKALLETKNERSISAQALGILEDEVTVEPAHEKFDRYVFDIMEHILNKKREQDPSIAPLNSMARMIYHGKELSILQPKNQQDSSALQEYLIQHCEAGIGGIPPLAMLETARKSLTPKPKDIVAENALR